MKEILKEKFINIYNEKYDSYFFSPGRVNLIGEHIDYNGGFVMPCAISYGTHAVVGLRDDNLVQVFSDGFSEKIVSFSLADLEKNDNDGFLSYIKGVFHVFDKKGFKVDHGFNIHISNTMPTNAGLSSSASLEVLIATILNDYFKFNITKQDIAVLCQEVENKYVGVNSGIMDQFSVACGVENRALLLNTSTLEYDLIPLELGDIQLVIMNSNKQRSLKDSKYNERFSECQTALKILKEHYPINHLCELTPNDLDKVKKIINNEIIYKRVKHVITEQDRTIKSKAALENNNVKLFASLINGSHDSLRHDYEVTGYELDLIADTALNHGAIGARMTGAGFGGCVIALVHKNDVDTLKEEISKVYNENTEFEVTFLEVKISEGAHREEI